MRNWIKEKRFDKDLDQEELASLLGCSRSYISLVENNLIEPSEEFVQKAVDIFGIPKEELFPVL